MGDVETIRGESAAQQASFAKAVPQKLADSKNTTKFLEAGLVQCAPGGRASRIGSSDGGGGGTRGNAGHGSGGGGRGMRTEPAVSWR